MANNLDPSVKIILEQFSNILIIHVREGTDKPYKCSSGFYLRQGPNSQKLKRDEILAFSVGEGKIRFDEQFNSKFDFDKDIDKKKINNFLKTANLKKNLPYEDVLTNLDVAQKQENKLLLKNAGILFFAKQPQKFVKESYLTCARYKGDTRTNIIDRADINDDLITQIEEGIQFLKRNIRLSYKFVGKPAREEIY